MYRKHRKKETEKSKIQKTEKVERKNPETINKRRKSFWRLNNGWAAGLSYTLTRLTRWRSGSGCMKGKSDQNRAAALQQQQQQQLLQPQPEINFRVWMKPAAVSSPLWAAAVKQAEQEVRRRSAGLRPPMPRRDAPRSWRSNPWVRQIHRLRCYLAPFCFKTAAFLCLRERRLHRRSASHPAEPFLVYELPSDSLLSSTV